MATEAEILALLASDPMVITKKLNDTGIWSVQLHIKGNTLATLSNLVPEWLKARGDLLVSDPLEFGTEQQADDGEKALAHQFFELLDLAKTPQESLKVYSQEHFSEWKDTGVVPDVVPHVSPAVPEVVVVGLQNFKAGK